MNDVYVNDGYEQEIKTILKFAEHLIFQQTNIYCSELQQNLLLSVLDGERKNYDQIAAECGYSVTYIRQDVAPKLWNILSQALDKKITKANIRPNLEKAIAQQQFVPPVQSDSSAHSPPAPSQDIHGVPPALVNEAIALEPSLTPTPAIPSDTPELPSPSASPSDLPSPDVSIKGNILLVDDQPRNLRLLADLLEEQGYEVQEAINGPVALQVISVITPDLILLDINMPNMDGYSVCQQLKANAKTKDIPVIFISAVDEAWDKVRAFSVGGVDYITKPFKVVEVLARVKNQLAIQTLQQELKARNAQLQQAIHELQSLAVIDHVTQVASRYRFDQYLQAEWHQAMQDETPLCLMLCHLDDFDAYLQSQGYQAGDRCLYQVAQGIKRVVQRPADLVCRYGGDIFAVILPNLEVDTAEAIAQNLLGQIESLSVCQNPSANPTSFTTSIGLAALVSSPGLGLETLMEQCDLALQTAKAEGGNTVVVARSPQNAS
ncbi:MAG: diguanylate cyclase [Leptolyngbyaceae cyanobacterium]